jgi:hypothetical protein
LRGTLKPVAEQRVSQAHGEEGQPGGQVDDVEHVDSVRLWERNGNFAIVT